MSAPAPRSVVVIGGGPAGLMAAQVLAEQGAQVDVYDAMPSVGRKFLLAGKGGLNLTHGEPSAAFFSRFGSRQAQLQPLLESFGAQQVRAWAQGLGVETFVGSSGRVFPLDMKSAPLLRAWLHRLRATGVRFHMRCRWKGWADWVDPLAQPTGSLLAGLQFDSPMGRVTIKADAVVLALGGASWPQLGSTGAWVAPLSAAGVVVRPLQPANCGFDLAKPWSSHVASRFVGQPLKSVAIRVAAAAGDAQGFHRKGEFVITASGVEGSLIYAASQLLRDRIAAHGEAVFELDLLPDRPADQVLAQLMHPRGSRSLSGHLKGRLGLQGLKAALLHEFLPRDALVQGPALAQAIKALPIRLATARPVAEAISTAGGVAFSGLDAGLMLVSRPGVFCAGEMLDWEAPTGGYLLTACLATGRTAGLAAARFVGRGVPTAHTR